VVVVLAVSRGRTCGRDKEVVAVMRRKTRIELFTVL
jgi:hypothetical protein